MGFFAPLRMFAIVHNRSFEIFHFVASGAHRGTQRCLYLCESCCDYDKVHTTVSYRTEIILPAVEGLRW